MQAGRVFDAWWLVMKPQVQVSINVRALGLKGACHTPELWAVVTAQVGKSCLHVNATRHGHLGDPLAALLPL